MLVLLDQSHSLFFGSRLNFKSVTAAETCALLAWATLNHGDRIGGVVFDEEQLSEIRPKRSKQTLMHLLKKTSEHNQALQARSIPASVSAANGGYLAKALRHARRVSHPGTHIFVVSDFAQHNEETLRHFTRLSRHCEMMAIHISDPMEANLPRPGRYDITNGLHQQTIETASSSVRHKYRTEYEQQLSTLKDQFTSLKIPFVSLGADQDTASQLALHFGSVRRG